MKKTVIYETIDGHDVIKGFDRPTVDPVETSKIVNGYEGKQGLIHETPEYQAAQTKKAEYSQAVKELSVLQKKYKKGARVSGEDQNKWNTALGVMQVRQDELKPLARKLSDKTLALRREHAVYFTPRHGEVIMAADEVDALGAKIKARKSGTVITLDGSEVEDNRNCIFFRKSGGKWGRTHIVRLGDKVPADAVLDQDVTDTQRNEIERDRVLSLPDTEKAAEKAVAMGAALNMAAGMRSRLEIQSDSKALAKSKKAYEAEVARIEGLYG